MSASKLEGTFLLYWRALKGPQLEPEVQFHPDRKWRFDFAIRSIRVAIEIEGGTYCGGRHTRPEGFARDCEKYNAASMLGWTVLKLDRKMIKERKRLEPLITYVHTRLLESQSAKERGALSL